MVVLEPWFIPVDIISIMGTGIAAILGLISLLIIIFDKKCHTLPMMLIANASISAIAWGFSMFSIAIFTLQNDLQQVQTYDIFCIVRPYFGYGLCGTFNFSFTLQAFYRYMLVVYPNRLFYQSTRFQLFLIILTWIYGFIVPIEFIARDEVIYNVDNQICQVPLHLSFSVIYMANCVYLIPIFIIILIYYKLLRYVKRLNTHTTSVNIVARARHELKMVTRIITIIMILLILGIPYVIFILMSFFTIPPKYHFRIAFIFLDVSMGCVLIVLFLFTDQFKRFIKPRRNIEPGTIVHIP
ncbi:unnamed protein product, partial [Adineta ricciae]